MENLEAFYTINIKRILSLDYYTLKAVCAFVLNIFFKFSDLN